MSSIAAPKSSERYFLQEIRVSYPKKSSERVFSSQEKLENLAKKFYRKAQLRDAWLLEKTKVGIRILIFDPSKY